MLDAPVSLTALIADRRLCLSCLASATHMRVEALETAIEVLGRAVRLQRDAARCDECGAFRVVVYA